MTAAYHFTWTSLDQTCLGTCPSLERMVLVVTNGSVSPVRPRDRAQRESRDWARAGEQIDTD